MSAYWCVLLGHVKDRPVFQVLSPNLIVGVLQQPAANDS